MEDIAFGYVHKAKFSPDSDVLIVAEETGIGAYRLAACEIPHSGITMEAERHE